MSMFCSKCGAQATIIGFMGYLTGETLLIVKQKVLTRGFFDGVEEFFAQAATTTKMPCSVCNKETTWLAEHRETFARPEKVALVNAPKD